MNNTKSGGLPGMIIFRQAAFSVEAQGFPSFVWLKNAGIRCRMEKNILTADRTDMRRK